MSDLSIGSKVPDFTLPATGDQEIRLKKLKGKNVVLYFYPKDSTPGCTTEGHEFSELHAEFDKLGTEVFGVSRDSIKSHENFKTKQGFPFELLSDQDETLCQMFNVIREKNMYGKKVMGIERSTFLIDARGVLRQEWRKVKAAGHAAEVLEALKAL
jgi:thioredoxin-dependent peroxiredoxin